MTLAPWRSPLARALHRNRSRAYSRYPQLATIRPDGRPANRTIVFRGFADDANDLHFVTDVRSEKIEQIAHNSHGELCWYFTQTREQFRLSGSIRILDSDNDDGTAQQIRHQAWTKLSDKAKQQFVWPHPGQPRAGTGYDPVEAWDEQPVDTFAVLIFAPDAVDHLELRGEPQNRYQYWQVSDGSWQSQAVNP